MKYLVIGSGGREHVIAWRLINDGSASEVFVAPGNGGIDEKYRVKIDIKNHSEVIRYVRENSIDMVVIGPEAPLVDGLADSLNAAGISVFGPEKAAAELEGSKIFAKKIMMKYNVPTAEYYEFTSKSGILDQIEKTVKFPIVIKLDGLAAGKGVGIPQNKTEAVEFINEVYTDGNRIFIEEFLEGEEVSILGISDGKNIKPLISAQDHKRIFDGDKGPNTGGMGAYAPAPVATAEIIELVQKQVLQPVVDGMAKEGIPFKGILYAGIIVKNNQIKVLEFNVRFGDPEAQVILPLLDMKLGDLFRASIEGTLDKINIKFKDKSAITVVVSSGGYPGVFEKGKVISGLDGIDDSVIVFHAGTERNDENRIVTSGGRVLAVTALGDDLSTAREKVYSRIQNVTFDGAFYRKDIAYRAFNR
ncbi:MAG: phosphoribosylamine--glycine ligase [Spirochaetes bacterium]|nr:phosphoribosylamine--glycine ligase [Spirochaetota bacterium]